MFPNLNTEQTRKNMTDTNVANLIGLKRATYGRKNRQGGLPFKSV